VSIATRALRAALACAVAIAAVSMPARARAFGEHDALHATPFPACETPQLTKRAAAARPHVAASRAVEWLAASLSRVHEGAACAGFANPCALAPVDRPLVFAQSSSPDRAPPTRS